MRLRFIWHRDSGALASSNKSHAGTWFGSIQVASINVATLVWICLQPSSRLCLWPGLESTDCQGRFGPFNLSCQDLPSYTAAVEFFICRHEWYGPHLYVGCHFICQCWLLNVDHECWVLEHSKLRKTEAHNCPASLASTASIIFIFYETKTYLNDAEHTDPKAQCHGYS